MNIYEKKIPEDLDCGLNVFMKVLGGKWKACIVEAITKGHYRPSEIHRYIKAATPRVIDIQLSELEEFGVVSKQTYPGFPLKVEYSLTSLGLSLIPIIAQMDKWGDGNAIWVKKIENLRHLRANDISTVTEQ